MALIFPGSVCATCNQPLDRPYTATSGCAFPTDDPLFPFCDAPLHFDCLETWEYRHEFSAGYYLETLASHKSGYGTLLIKESDWFLATGPSMPGGFPYFVCGYLIDWPITLYTTWQAWEAFLAGGYADGLCGLALERAAAVIEEVSRRLPTQKALEKLYRQRT